MISGYSIIGLMVLGQLLILQVNTIKYLKQNIISRYFLALLICLSFLLIHDTLVHSRYILNLPHFTFTGEALTLLIWPFLFLITKEILNKKKSIYDWFHFLPFILYTMYRFSDYILPTYEKIALLESFYNVIDNQTVSVIKFHLEDFLYDLFLHRLQPFAYIIIIFSYIYPHFISRDTKNISKRLKWLGILIFGFLIIWILKYLTFLYGFFFPPFTLSHPVAIVFIAIQVFLISQFALTTRTGIPAVFALKKELSEKELETIAKNAKYYIRSNHAYLNTGLTLHFLSKELDTNSSYLSKAINEYFKMNFNDFINEFRIEKAKQIIGSPKIDFYSLEGVAKESGFNSVSTFNRAFLKVEGKTPTQYKKSVNS